MIARQFHPWFWYALTFEVLEHCWCQSNPAILLWNPVVLRGNVYNYSPKYCKLYHLANSKAQKLNNQVRIAFTIFGIRMRLASSTRGWLWLDFHMLTARFICGPKSSLLYVNIYISLVQCPGGKFRVTFNVKRIKSLTKLKKNWKRISRGGKWHLTSEFGTSQFPDEMV